MGWKRERGDEKLIQVPRERKEKGSQEGMSGLLTFPFQFPRIDRDKRRSVSCICPANRSVFFPLSLNVTLHFRVP